MGENTPSFTLVQTKIPKNDARIRWGIGQPTHHTTSEAPANKIENNESIASSWATLIKEKGLAYIHGKLNSYWFDDSKEPHPIYEPGFENLGQINTSIQKSDYGTSPNGPHEVDIRRADSLQEKDKHSIQYLIISQPVNPNFQPDQTLLKRMRDLVFSEGSGSPSISQEMRLQPTLAAFVDFNKKQLGGKFSSPWREVSWVFWADRNQTKIGPDQQDIVSWRTNDPLQVVLNIFLENDDAELLFTQMQTHPEELPALLRTLYPKTAGDYPLKTIEGETLKVMKNINPAERNFSPIVQNAQKIPLK